ncbi:MAG: sodium:solute symporter family protein [Pirellula sp.]|jgi:Na+/proline symporter|nr:sodium:solute symporter family protein [Pirellula sp.]
MPWFLADGAMSIQLSQWGLIGLAVAIVLYMLALLGVSIYASTQVKDEQDFLVAGRRLPLHLSWGALMATWFGSSAIIGASKAAWESGLSGVILDPFACSATLLFTGLVFASPLWRSHLFTIADFYRKKYGKRAEYLACLIQLTTFFCWIASQYIALGSVLQAYFGMNPMVAIIGSAVVVTIYTLIGGMWSVTLTDAIQIVVALIGLVILGYAVMAHIGEGNVIAGVQTVLAKQPPERLKFVPDWTAFGLMAAIGTFLTGLLGNVPGQDLQQRVFTAKNPRTASLACILSAAAYFPFGLIPVMLGLAAFSLGIQMPENDTDGHMLLPMLAAQFLHEGLVIVFVLAVISIIVSVACSATISEATILASNVLGGVKLFEGRHLLLDRLCVILVTIGSVLLAFSGESIMGLLDIQLSIAMVALFVPLLMGVFSRPRNEICGLLAMLIGGAVWGLRYAFEIFWYAPPEDLSYARYPDFVYSQLGGDTGGIVAQLGYLYALVPSDIQGLILSFVGYYIGQYCFRHTPGHFEAEPVSTESAG